MGRALAKPIMYLAVRHIGGFRFALPILRACLHVWSREARVAKVTQGRKDKDNALRLLRLMGTKRPQVAT